MRRISISTMRTHRNFPYPSIFIKSLAIAINFFFVIVKNWVPNIAIASIVAIAIVFGCLWKTQKCSCGQDGFVYRTENMWSLPHILFLSPICNTQYLFSTPVWRTFPLVWAISSHILHQIVSMTYSYCIALFARTCKKQNPQKTSPYLPYFSVPRYANTTKKIGGGGLINPSHIP